MKLRVLEKLGGSPEFRNNFKRVLSGAGLAQLINLLSIPLLSRLYQPTDFALLAYFMSLHAIAVAAMSLPFEWILPNSRNKFRGASLAMSAVYASIAGVFLLGCLGLFVLWLAPPFLDFARWGVSGHFLLALLCGSTFAGISRSVLFSWLVYQGNLTYFAASLLFQALSNVLISVSAILLFSEIVRVPGLILIYGFIVAQVMACSVMIIGHRDTVSILRIVPFRHTLRIGWKFSGLALQSNAVNVMNAFSFSFQVFIIGYVYGDTATGLYSLAARICLAPVAFLSSALANSFWTEASSLAKTNLSGLRSFYIATIRKLTVFAILLCFGLFIMSFFIERLLGAEDWEGLQFMVLAILPFVFANLIFGPTNHLTVYNKQAYQLISDGLSVLGLIVALLLSGWWGLGAPIGVGLAMLIIGFGYLLRGTLHLLANTQAGQK